MDRNTVLATEDSEEDLDLYIKSDSYLSCIQRKPHRRITLSSKDALDGEPKQSYSPASTGFSSMATWWSKINFDIPDFEFLPSTSLIVCLRWSIWNSRNNWSFRELKDDPIRI
ncbi:hypothetical protein Goari_006887 [Gossypium aridum]|uniref:Uncharacterized protein n=1 Tax=Gossypium aridum TaxID=34290 RepID=A0A7J8XPC1_GOSAI|nr:hypothetical protein [Gossypium aridum]